ncbi:hypothetical protein HBI56_035070 [Parastagonospora nodorum]|uniref:Uncharacterized protein n=1 Tax=Phaeosphaeria nodorum (strain SN15 / ATCC MYA-4574 / FGSC 10173) TaxID=321614 RepID=A0A7U2HZ14_PHANO|nr:hypothetical protein HBH56_022880 [Parastagonospora nodorum]QRC95624.1 hypothetical protein JI435_407680 [Parastagonospora nodorum SN15]KAH3937334.1 hypothetical protein HBH54_011590 [Parastagonospora nodorum]KAH3943988.1 hypothetical protein HBH53_165130 [Parastagonospora nodorum]KAH3967689.1 hypothetical protein HBH51_135040 [Parastagonospora nodorum]
MCISRQFHDHPAPLIGSSGAQHCSLVILHIAWLDSYDWRPVHLEVGRKLES